jgi:hypothetical protein
MGLEVLELLASLTQHRYSNRDRGTMSATEATLGGDRDTRREWSQGSGMLILGSPRGLGSFEDRSNESFVGFRGLARGDKIELEGGSLADARRVNSGPARKVEGTNSAAEAGTKQCS